MLAIIQLKNINSNMPLDKKIKYFDKEIDLSKTCFIFLGRNGAGTRDLARISSRYLESKSVSLRDDGLILFIKNIFNSNYIVYIHASPWILLVFFLLLSKKQYFLVHNSQGFQSNMGMRGFVDSLILKFNILAVRNLIFLSPHVADTYKNRQQFRLLSDKKFIDIDYNKKILKKSNGLKPKIFFFGRYLPYKNLKKFVNLSYSYKEFLFYIYSYNAPYESTDNLHVVRTWVAEENVDIIYKTHDILVLPYAETTQSGPFYLAIEHNTIIVAPDISGFREYSDYSGLILYQPNICGMLESALESAINKYRNL